MFSLSDGDNNSLLSSKLAADPDSDKCYGNLNLGNKIKILADMVSTKLLLQKSQRKLPQEGFLTWNLNDKDKVIQRCEYRML